MSAVAALVFLGVMSALVMTIPIYETWKYFAGIRALNRLVLNGVPLPATDDPRWTNRLTLDPTLGKFVLKYDTVILDGVVIDSWPAYCSAVRANLRANEVSALAKRAQAEIEEAP